MKLHDCVQYSNEWWAVRRGKPTASEFGCIITAKTGALAAGSHKYLCRLVGDTLDLEYPRAGDYATIAMQRGTALEPKARRMYEWATGEAVQLVGFCTTDDGRFGCSPDALVGEDGCLELKNPSAAQHVAWVLDGTLPADYRAQVHGHLIVTGRKWCDFVSYLPGEPLFIVRTCPDAFTDKLRACLDEFHAAYTAALARFRPAGSEAAA